MSLEYLGRAVTFVFNNKVIKKSNADEQDNTIVFHFVDEDGVLIHIALDPEDIPQDFYALDEWRKNRALQDILDLSQENLPKTIHRLSDPYQNEFPVELQYISEKR